MYKNKLVCIVFLYCDDGGGIWSVGMLLIVVHKLAKGIFTDVFRRSYIHTY